MELVESIFLNLQAIIPTSSADYSTLTNTSESALLPNTVSLRVCIERIDVPLEPAKFFRRNDGDYFLAWHRVPLSVAGLAAMSLFSAAAVRRMLAHPATRKYYLLVLNKVGVSLSVYSILY